MSLRLLRACQALETAVMAAGSSAPQKPSQAATRRVLRHLRHLRLVLAPPDKHARPSTPAVTTHDEPSMVRLVKPVEPESTGESDESEWDPDPVQEQLEASRCRALLLEIVRRAIYDWVLYRQHNRLELKEIAADAYTWLFEEDESHPWWRHRVVERRTLTSLVSICDVLDLEPKTIRARARNMNIKTILSVGRPPETRHRRLQDDVEYQEHSVSDTIDLHSIDNDDNSANYYESYYSVSTSL